MKKTLQILLVTLIFSTTIYGQSTERFIRIIGNAKKELTANKAKVQLTITEQKATKYKEDSKDIAFEDVYTSTIAELSKYGIAESDLEVIIQSKTYSRATSKSYYFTTDINTLEDIANITVDGAKITDIKYLYDTSDEDLETELSLLAINDAKRKAKTIGDEINMTIGKILNIEVKESSFGTDSVESKKNEITKSYRIAITFKLVD